MVVQIHLSSDNEQISSNNNYATVQILMKFGFVTVVFEISRKLNLTKYYYLQLETLSVVKQLFQIYITVHYR